MLSYPNQSLDEEQTVEFASHPAEISELHPVSINIPLLTAIDFSLCPLRLIIFPALFNLRQQALNLISFRVRQLLFPKPDPIVRVCNISRFVHTGGGGKLQRRLVQLALDALLFQ